MNLRVGVVAASRFFGRFALLLGLSLVAMAFGGAVPLFGDLLETKLKGTLGDRGYDLAEQGFAVLAVLSIAVVGVAHDLARAAVVIRDLRALEAARLGAATLQAFPWRGLGGWSWRATVGLALVTVAALTTARIGVATTARFAAVTLVHQATALLLVFLRADWLSHAVRLVRLLPRDD